MLVFRITTARWSNRLSASGSAARWNNDGRFMIYTAASRALACLENLVHRRGIGPDELFRVIGIQIPETLAIGQINHGDLPTDWRAYTQHSVSQALGDRWLSANAETVLRVPSAIIPEEFNYLINPQHPDFSSIRMESIEEFIFNGHLIQHSI